MQLFNILNNGIRLYKQCQKFLFTSSHLNSIVIKYICKYICIIENKITYINSLEENAC